AAAGASRWLRSSRRRPSAGTAGGAWSPNQILAGRLSTDSPYAARRGLHRAHGVVEASAVPRSAGTLRSATARRCDSTCPPARATPSAHDAASLSAAPPSAPPPRRRHDAQRSRTTWRAGDPASNHLWDRLLTPARGMACEAIRLAPGRRRRPPDAPAARRVTALRSIHRCFARGAAPTAEPKKLVHALPYLVADLSHPSTRLVLWIPERPVLALERRHDRAGLATSHRDEERRASDELGCESHRPGHREIESNLPHDLPDLGRDACSGCRTR